MGINLGGLAPEPQNDIKQQVAPAAPVIPEGATQVDRGNGLLSLNLNKGITLDLAKTLPTLEKLSIGLGWDPAQEQQMDLDVFALGLHNGKVTAVSDIVYFAQRNVIPGVNLSADNRTGDGEGDDETIDITLSQVPAAITEIAVFVNIYEADKKGQNFGMVRNSYCRLINKNTGKEEAIYILNESDAALYDTFHFVTLERNANGWNMKTVGRGMKGNVQEIANQFL